MLRHQTLHGSLYISAKKHLCPDVQIFRTNLDSSQHVDGCVVVAFGVVAGLGVVDLEVARVVVQAAIDLDVQMGGEARVGVGEIVGAEIVGAGVVGAVVVGAIVAEADEDVPADATVVDQQCYRGV